MSASQSTREARNADQAFGAVPVRPVVMKAQPARARLEQAKGATLLVAGFRGNSASARRCSARSARSASMSCSTPPAPWSSSGTPRPPTGTRRSRA